MTVRNLRTELPPPIGPIGSLPAPPTTIAEQMLALQKKRILVTRTQSQASDLAARLESLGATPILIPTIEIVPPESYAPLDAALAQLETYDWLLFTSVNAVEVFHQRRNPSLKPGAPRPDSGTWVSGSHLSPKIAVIGPATARAVQGIGLQVDLVPPKYIAESLAEALAPEAHGKRVLFIRAAEARDILPEALTAAGATLTIVEAYRNQIPPESIPALRQLFASPASYPDAITFTSASTARNLIALLEAASLTLPPSVVLASIGPVTSQALRDLGHPPHLEADEPTIPALIETLTRSN
ncbi:MAG TPA: uroporphyrinogen-III synthase [Edaphobacter sp.]|uniref:uroporphyrinogen-III synthase n=1 Tax=Edaphobacter sp. TaxID=1934404 RepID=UPI002C41E3B4|nr:uroporphyrinogen-III synthase [Edaphobacter sp.]HUZ96293.1 uroporphyrinogen-III synthase [Edaphobacter sp.]